MRVLVTGSRDWTGIYGESKIYMVLNMLLAFCEVLGQKLTIVHGDGPGADQTIDAWAVRRDDSGVTVERHPAAWRTVLGKGAGPVRNREMVNLGADMCIGFLKNASRGTLVTLTLAQEAGIPTFTVHWQEEHE